MARSLIEIRGARKLIAKLKKLPRNVERRVLRKAVNAGTGEILKAVKAATPVDEGVLWAMQTRKVAGKGMSLYGVVGADVAKLKAAAGVEGEAHRPSNIDWLVEHGHVMPDGTFVPPTGYMSKSAAESLPRAEAKFIETLASGLEKEASR